MIAKIGKGDNLYGALTYNHEKVSIEKGAILFTNKIPETLNGQYSVAYLQRCFLPYLLANNKTEKPVRHISLNPSPSDNVSDNDFIQIADQYMKEMGYSNQPYIVFKHTDIDRTHIHIVTTCVQLSGKKIPDSYDHQRSMAICRKIEKEFNLKPAAEQNQSTDDKIFEPIDYSNGDIKSQLASIVRHLPKYYQFQTLGGYNALLSLFNITSEKVTGEYLSKPKNGLVYFALNENGAKVSSPFKSSLFGKQAGLEHLETLCKASKQLLKNHPKKALIKRIIESALYLSESEKVFKEQLTEDGISAVIRRNPDGRIYGVSFIDHDSKTVWNGSLLGKHLSANVLNDLWAPNNKPKAKEEVQENIIQSEKSIMDEAKIQPHTLFDFTKPKETFNEPDTGLIEALGGLIPTHQGEDYEEIDFANRMKKKSKRKRNK